MLKNQESFSEFANNLYLNFWNDKINPIIIDFIESECPWLISNYKTEWTAYPNEPFVNLNEELVRSEFFFKEHPYFKGEYIQSSFVMNLRKHESKTVGLISTRVFFLFSDKLSCINTFNSLCNKFRDLGGTNEKRISKHWVSFLNPINTWPYEIQIKVNKNEHQKFSYSITFFHGHIEE